MSAATEKAVSNWEIHKSGPVDDWDGRREHYPRSISRGRPISSGWNSTAATKVQASVSASNLPMLEVPGWLDSHKLPKAVAAPARSLVSIEDVGVATAFLAHDAARLITGETLYVDGGYHIID